MTNIVKTKRTTTCSAAGTTKDIEWTQMTAMKVVKSPLYRGMFFYCVIIIVSSILQYKNCDSYTFAKNDSWFVFRGVLKDVCMRAANYFLTR